SRQGRFTTHTSREIASILSGRCRPSPARQSFGIAMASNRKVAFFDANNDYLCTLKKGEAEKLSKTPPHSLPRWSSKTDIKPTEPETSNTGDFLVTLHLLKLGLQYNIQRWLGYSTELYIKESSRASKEPHSRNVPE